MQVTIERAYQFRSSSEIFLWGYVYWTVQNARAPITHVIDWGDRTTSAVQGQAPGPNPGATTPPTGDPWVRGHDYGKTGTFIIAVTSKDADGKTARVETELVIGKGNDQYGFERGDGCDIRGTGADHTAIVSVAGQCVYANPGPGGRIQVSAAVVGGVLEHPIVVGRVWNNIRSGPGTYQMRANVSWKGSLVTEVGVGGARVSSSIAIHVVDTSGRDLVAPHIVDERELTQSGISAGLLSTASPAGGKPVVFDFTIPRAQSGTWRIELRITCEVSSGLIGVDLWCVYHDAFLEKGFVEYSTDRDGYIFLLDKTLE